MNDLVCITGKCIKKLDRLSLNSREHSVYLFKSLRISNISDYILVRAINKENIQIGREYIIFGFIFDNLNNYLDTYLSRHESSICNTIRLLGVPVDLRNTLLIDIYLSYPVDILLQSNSPKFELLNNMSGLKSDLGSYNSSNNGLKGFGMMAKLYCATSFVICEGIIDSSDIENISDNCIQFKINIDGLKDYSEIEGSNNSRQLLAYAYGRNKSIVLDKKGKRFLFYGRLQSYNKGIFRNYLSVQIINNLRTG